MRIIKKIIGFSIIILGIGIFLYPDFRTWQINRRTEQIIDELKQSFSDVSVPYKDKTEESETETENTEKLYYQELYDQMAAYNENLIENGQNLVDAWSYAQEPINLDALDNEDGAIGYIEIPDMDVKLPLYIGATESNMALGAAVMSETSMPIGGADTNCVIAGHRGYSGAPYFRDIEELKIGSLVYITNPWKQMIYKVVQIEIIDPHDVESILIQPGKDMVTLLTCHPYMSHGRSRYVVYCERVDQKSSNSNSDSNASINAENISSETEQLYPAVISSSDAIAKEALLRKVVPVIVLIISILILTKPKKEKKKD